MTLAAAWAEASAPLRVCDAGGWTDTWFAGRGLVCNLAVGPGVEVRVEAGCPGDLVELDLPAFGDRYAFALDAPPGRHPLLEATLRRWAPPAVGLRVVVRTFAPVGLGAGGSAAVVVALVGALRALTGGALDRDDVARAAFEVETVELGWQSGVQDQCAAAHGGASLVVVDPYPSVEVRRLDVPEPAWEELAGRLVTVYLGHPHRSSAEHEQVIARLEHDDAARAALVPLRAAARAAADALVAGDLEAYGAALAANTAAQAALHEGLVGPVARAVIALARRHGALGWKVNGAGGDGGSVSIVGPGEPSAFRAALAARPGIAVLDLRPARDGLTVRAG